MKEYTLPYNAEEGYISGDLFYVYGNDVGYYPDSDTYVFFIRLT